MDAGLLPVKPLLRAKGRLAPDFDEHERVAIARALLADALELCSSVTALRWWVVSDDPEVRSAARAAGLDVRGDGHGDLNLALGAALREIERLGARSATILPADVPLARVDDVADILDTGATSDVVVVPARAGGGTNALFLSPPTLIAPRFGPGSLRAHAEVSDQRSLRCSILSLPRLALDLDTPADVADFLVSSGAGDHTRRALRALRPPVA